MQEAFPIVNMIPLLSETDDITTTGLEDFIIYDVPDFSTTETVTVNALQFSVDCKAIPNARQVGEFDVVNSSIPIQVNEALQDVWVIPSKLRISFDYSI